VSRAFRQAGHVLVQVVHAGGAAVEGEPRLEQRPVEVAGCIAHTTSDRRHHAGALASQPGDRLDEMHMALLELPAAHRQDQLAIVAHPELPTHPGPTSGIASTQGVTGRRVDLAWQPQGPRRHVRILMSDQVVRCVHQAAQHRDAGSRGRLRRDG
jgi:hypothetical protein